MEPAPEEAARGGSTGLNPAGGGARPASTAGALVISRLRRLASACDRIAPSTWVRSGAPLPLLFFGVWLVPFMLAGVVRYVTTLGLGPSLALALALSGLLVATLGARPRVAPWGESDAARRWLQMAGGVIGVVLTAWAASVLFSPDMGALSVYFGPDGGTHIAIRHTFVESDPKVYAGFVSLYAATGLLDRILALAPPGSLTLAFYSTVAIVVVVPVVAMVTLLQGRLGQRGYRLIGLVVFSIAWCACLNSVALPVLSNIQVDGFYAHFFGFLPLALLWAADVLFRPTLLRTFWSGLAVLLLRFTYGLNLGDALVACGGLWLLDAVGARRRAVPLLVGAGAVAAGIVAYLNLAPVFLLGGYVEGYPYKELPKVVDAVVIALAAYGVGELWAEARRIQLPPPDSDREMAVGLLRIIRLPLAFGAVSLLAYQRFLKIPKVETYYLLKYQLMPLVFVAAAASIALGYSVFLLLTRRLHPLLAIVLAGVLFTLGTASVEANGVFKTWRQELAERNGPPPHAKLRPLVDPEIWKAIETTLRGERKSFGGFVSADFAAGHFLNAWMGIDKQFQVFYPPDLSPGHCVFWTHASDDAPGLWNPDRGALEAARSRLEADAAKVCSTYDPPWAMSRHSICHRCY